MIRSFDKISGIVFLLISLLFISGSLKISGSAYGSAVGPKTYPFILGIILGLLSLRLIYESFKRTTTQHVGKSQMYYKNFGVILVAAILYAFLLELIGFIISTFLFLLVAFQVMEKGKIISSILIAFIFSIGVYLMYVNLLGGTLPKFSLF